MSSSLRFSNLPSQEILARLLIVRNTDKLGEEKLETMESEHVLLLLVFLTLPEVDITWRNVMDRMEFKVGNCIFGGFHSYNNLLFVFMGNCSVELSPTKATDVLLVATCNC